MASNDSPDRSASLGVFSLRAAAWGFLIPILFVLALVALRVDLGPEERGRVTRLLALLFGGMEVIALLAGFVAWSSRAGKTGVLLAAVLLVSGLVFAAVELNWIGAGESRRAADAPAAPASEPSAPAMRPAAPARPVSPPGEGAATPPAEPPPRRGSPGELFPNVAPQN